MYQVQKKRKIGWLFFTMFLCAFLVGMGIGLASKYLKNTPEEKTRDISQPVPIAQEYEELQEIPDRPASAALSEEPEQVVVPEITYYVVAQSGKVCVFVIDEKGQWRFSHNLSIELDSLREEDKKLFEEGLTVSSKEELLSLVEDFSS